MVHCCVVLTASCRLGTTFLHGHEHKAWLAGSHLLYFFRCNDCVYHCESPGCSNSGEPAGALVLSACSLCSLSHFHALTLHDLTTTLPLVVPFLRSFETDPTITLPSLTLALTLNLTFSAHYALLLC